MNLGDSLLFIHILLLSESLNLLACGILIFIVFVVSAFKKYELSFFMNLSLNRMISFYFFLNFCCLSNQRTVETSLFGRGVEVVWLGEKT